MSKFKHTIKKIIRSFKILLEKINYQYSLLEDFFYNVKWYFRNIHNFRNSLWRFRPWDHSYCLLMYNNALQLLKHELENGHEEVISKTKKTNKIQEVISLVELEIDVEIDKFADYNEALKQYGEITNTDISDLLPKLENKRWSLNNQQFILNLIRNRICRILNGQDYNELYEKYKYLKKHLTLEEKQALLDDYIKANNFDPSKTRDDDYDNVIHNAAFDGTGAINWWD